MTAHWKLRAARLGLKQEKLDVETLKALLAEQEALLDRQHDLLDAQEKHIESLVNIERFIKTVGRGEEL